MNENEFYLNAGSNIAKLSGGLGCSSLIYLGYSACGYDLNLKKGIGCAVIFGVSILLEKVSGSLLRCALKGKEITDRFNPEMN